MPLPAVLTRYDRVVVLLGAACQASPVAIARSEYPQAASNASPAGKAGYPRQQLCDPLCPLT
jgi:hypothetical protein